MGVSALFMSAVTGIAKFIDPVEFVVFDNGLGHREETLVTADNRQLRLIRFGARGGRRYYRPENLATMELLSRLGDLGAGINEGIRLIDSCAAVLDISGGDSFSDIYGQTRFVNVLRPKSIAINRGKPLILMPQTYGPYKAPEVRELAASAVQGSSMAWARDSYSFEILKDLLGDQFNPEIHRCGVDMAFSLAPRPAANLLPSDLNAWLENKTAENPLIGFNISGLIYNDPEGQSKKYGFKADYRTAVINFLKKILAETTARIVLISHVMDQPGHFESDLAACQDVANQLGATQGDRILISPASLDQSQVKWLIAQMDWFCGTRMHATIAGLSSCVPTAAVSYSDKTRGVFATCGQEAQVFDPRASDENGLVDFLFQSFSNRGYLADSLKVTVLPVIERATQQLQDIAASIHNGQSNRHV